MISIDTRRIVAGLKSIESIAVISRVSSTNLIARRVVSECIENDLPLPSAIIIAGEQFAGRGRNGRFWSSPAGKGIYATTLLCRPALDLAMLPLEIANIVAGYLREVFAIEAGIKWPNDILAGGRKIAGILIEARVQDDRAFLLVGTGVNVEPVKDETHANAMSISEATPRNFTGIADATVAFIEYVDERLARPFEPPSVLSEWRRLTVHRSGDRITCAIGDRTVFGTWGGIDDQGRALIRQGEETAAISAGDLIMTSHPPAVVP